ncbi:MAG: tRNA guanosine(34) transglycosylase Tgt [Flammeovirgaceae bacterium]|nr:tRNA guanosine(34) transglycosylase Tgt [Flammeovirgaceae bacterium]
MRFTVLHTDKHTRARVGEIVTERGTIPTPIFMPVGTVGTVKAIHQRELIEDIRAHIILGNTYHLYLRPGLDILQRAGGLHGLMNWHKPILTDSGGYQVYSLAQNRKISEEGVTFKSHLDGSTHVFTPEKAIDIQRVIGADIVMAFDECPPYPCDYGYAKSSMELTHRWLERCRTHLNNTEPIYGKKQTLFPIVQGSMFKDLRKVSAEFVSAMNCDGNAIGGLSVGEPTEVMYEMTAWVCEFLPEHKPRYLMGVGTPANILECIALGIDMFDCIMPTRNARHGMIFTTKGILNMRNERWKNDHTPIDEALGGYVSTYYSKAYLRHLVVSKEILGAQIASLQNLRFYLWLVEEARKHILQGDFLHWKNEMTNVLMRRC